MAEMNEADLEGKARAAILAYARSKIGTSYDKLDCSHMVQQAYDSANLSFPYTTTRDFNGSLVGSVFVKISASQAKPGDIILYSKHVGIYDPDGCRIVNSAECAAKPALNSSMRILSARSGKNMGVEYGQSSWFGTGQYLTWKAFASKDVAAQDTSKQVRKAN